MQNSSMTVVAFLVMLVYLVVSAYVLLTFRPSPALFFAAFCFIFLGGVFIRGWVSVIARS